MEPKPLGELLREARLSGAEVARRLDIPKPTMSHYLRGYSRMPLHVAKRVAQLLGRPVDSIIFPREEASA